MTSSTYHLARRFGLTFVGFVIERSVTSFGEPGEIAFFVGKNWGKILQRTEQGSGFCGAVFSCCREYTEEEIWKLGPRWLTQGIDWMRRVEIDVDCCHIGNKKAFEAAG